MEKIQRGSRRRKAGLARSLDRIDRNAGVIVGCFVFCLLGMGMVYSLHLGNVFRFADERDYWDWATSIASAFTYQHEAFRAYRPPGYPALLALIIAADGPVWTARFLNFVLLAGSAVCLYDLGKRFARPAAGVVAACWIIAYPLFVYAAGTLYPQTLAAFLLLASLCLTTRQRSAWIACGGLVYGALILVVPTFAALAPLIALWLLFKPDRFSWRRPLLFCIFLVLPVTAWIARNHMVFDQWVFVSTNSGVNLALGNAPQTKPESGVNVDLSHIAIGPELDEVQRNRAYKRAAVHWMQAHPIAAGHLYLGKLAHYFAISEELATKSQANPLYAYILALSYAPLLAILVWRLISFRGFGWRSIELLIIALYSSFGLVMAVFFTRIRFRIPMDTLLLLVVGLGLTQLAERFSGSRRRPHD